jgi:hypothetical protein
MKKPTQGGVGSSYESKTRIAQRYTNIDNHKLYQTVAILEQASYTVTFAPVELWQHRCILTAWHPVTGEGFMVGPDELGLIIHYGAGYLDPYQYGNELQARHQNKNNPNRIRHYAEAVIARAICDVQTAQPGIRNQTLSRAAFVVGRYLLGWQLDPDSVQGQLLEAALQTGLDHREANTTIKRGLDAGQRNPRSPDELLNELVDEQPKQPYNDMAAKHLNKLRAKMGGYK